MSNYNRKTKNKAKIRIRLGHKVVTHKSQIIDILCQPLVMGADLLSKIGANLYVQKQTMTFESELQDKPTLSFVIDEVL